jgi:hypothetical protein
MLCLEAISVIDNRLSGWAKLFLLK